MSAPLPCVAMGTGIISLSRAVKQHRGDLSVNSVMSVTFHSVCLKVNTQNGQLRARQLTKTTPGRSTNADVSFTGSCTLLRHPPLLSFHRALQFGSLRESELAKEGQEKTPAEALWRGSKGLIRWKVPSWKWAKLFLVFHLSLPSECGWQLHCPFASSGLYPAACTLSCS